MKKYLRYIPILFAIMTFSLLVGCNPTYELKIHYDSSRCPDTFIDILIPISEDDEDYTEKPCCCNWQTRFGIDKEDEEKTSQMYESQLFLYNEDGFRSIMLHYKNLHYADPISNIIYPFADERRLNEMCEKYKVFKIALVSKNGEVLQVSEEVPLYSSKNHPIDDGTAYSAAENKVMPKYSTTYATPDLVVLCDIFNPFILFLLAAGGVIWLIGVIVRLVSRKPKKKKNYLSNAICFGILAIPGVIAAFYHMYDSFRATLTVNDGFKQLLMLLPVVILDLIPAILAVFYTVSYFCEKKKCEPTPAVVQPSESNWSMEDSSAPVDEMSDNNIDNDV